MRGHQRLYKPFNYQTERIIQSSYIKGYTGQLRAYVSKEGVRNMSKMRSFRDDEGLEEKLDAVPKNERSTIIRMALRDWFKCDEVKKRRLRLKTIDDVETAIERRD